MSNIILFPNASKKETEASVALPMEKPLRNSKAKRFLRATLRWVWVLVAMSWPITRWMVKLDLLFAFLRMLFHVTPHAGFEFIAHCVIAAALAGFVIFYRPDASGLPKKQPKNNRSTGNQNKRRSG